MSETLLDELSRIERWDDVRARLGEMANLGGPAPAAVTRRVLEDKTFAFYLLFTRDAPSLQRRLLEDPRNAAYERAEQEISTAALVGSAVKAFARWGGSGFRRLDPAAFAQRWETCLACPKLVEAPDRVIYSGLTILTGDRRVCSACGCVAEKKAQIPTESCPLGKWPEPVAAR